MRGPETEKSHQTRLGSGFYQKYMSGQGLDIGFRGSLATAEPVLQTATGVEMDYPGYDGVNLPFDDESQDYVFTSHVLEHIPTIKLDRTIQEWFRVTKVGGHIVIIVPHQYLYEKRRMLPSRWNRDHQRFYTPGVLMRELEQVLPEPNTWRLRLLQDNDENYVYTIPPDKHAGGCYEIVCVIQKIQKPEWSLI